MYGTNYYLSDNAETAKQTQLKAQDIIVFNNGPQNFQFYRNNRLIDVMADGGTMNGLPIGVDLTPTKFKISCILIALGLGLGASFNEKTPYTCTLVART